MWRLLVTVLISSTCSLFAADFSAGLNCYRAQDFECSIREWAPLADAGAPQIQYDLALAYTRAEGSPRNLEKAAQLLEQASNAGMVEAQYNLAFMYLNGAGVAKNEDTAISWLQKAAERGDINAAYGLGEVLEKKSDYGTALQWYRKAAEAGLAVAEFSVGQMYDPGHGVSQDFSQAVSWYRKAADQGNASALCNLAILYYNGEGVPLDREKSYLYFKVAAKAGEPRAANLIEAAANKLQKKQLESADEQVIAWEAAHPMHPAVSVTPPQEIISADAKVALMSSDSE